MLIHILKYMYHWQLLDIAAGAGLFVVEESDLKDGFRFAAEGAELQH